MMTHHLKTWPEYFQAVKRGDKPFEVRRSDDRTFEVGDVLILQEYDIEALERSRAFLRLAGSRRTDAEMRAHAQAFYTGDAVTRRVSYVFHGLTWQGQPAVALGLQEVEDASN